MNETPLQSADRLLKTLETLSAEEDCLLRAGDFSAAAALQAREQPVIDRLAELARLPELREAVESLWRDRVAPLVDSRQANADILRARMAEIKSRLSAAVEANARLRRVHPAYRHSGGRAGSLAATG